MINLIIAICLVVLLEMYKTNTSKQKGKQGERLVAKTLKHRRFDIILNNIIIKDGDKYAQLDHVLITKSAVYVIETKNHSGMIIGDKDSLNWLAVYGKQKYKIYNPVKQNNTHIKRLKAIIGDYPIKSIVIFSNCKCNLQTNIPGVYTLEEFNSKYKSICKTTNKQIPKYKILLLIIRNNLKYNPVHRIKQIKYAKIKSTR